MYYKEWYHISFISNIRQHYFQTLANNFTHNPKSLKIKHTHPWFHNLPVWEGSGGGTTLLPSILLLKNERLLAAEWKPGRRRLAPMGITDTGCEEERGKGRCVGSGEWGDCEGGDGVSVGLYNEACCVDTRPPESGGPMLLFNKWLSLFGNPCRCPTGLSDADSASESPLSWL